MQRTNFHRNSYGWNYFYEVKNGQILVGRYFSNGSQNSLTQRTKWGITDKEPQCWEDCSRLMD